MSLNIVKSSQHWKQQNNYILQSDNHKHFYDYKKGFMHMSLNIEESISKLKLITI